MTDDPAGTIYRIRFHPKVRNDLLIISRLIRDFAGVLSAERRLAEIEVAVNSLAETPHKGSLRHEIAPDLKAIPAGRRATIVFVVDDSRREVRVIAISYGGADWIARTAERS